MEARKEDFRIYLEESGVINALTNALVKLYGNKDERPANASEFIKQHMADNFPTLADYQTLLKDLEHHRAIFAQRTGQAGSEENLSGFIDTSTLTIEKAIELLKERQAGGKFTSLLIKHFNEDTFVQLKDKKTRNGKTLLDCIKVVFNFPEYRAGIYAADDDAYDIFVEIFKPIIEDHHGADLSVENHVDKDGGWDAGDNVLPALDGQYVESTRISCARLMSTYPPSPSMTQHHFLAVMSEVEGAVTSFTGELEGRFHQLKGMTDADKNTMITKGQWFKYDDESKLSKEAGALNFWNEGRAIFVNNLENFLVWVNEEDHVRFISTGTATDMKETYDRLKDAMASCPTLHFKHDNHLGWITSSPTNLGSTIRAAVTIKVPKLHTSGALEQLAESLQLEVYEILSGVQPAVGPSVGLYDISRTARIAEKEFDAVKIFCDRIKEVVDAEAASTGIPPTSTISIDDAIKLLATLKTKSPQSLLVKHLTADMITNLKDVATTNGRTLLDCINIGLKWSDASVGIYAADQDAYELFADIFLPIIKEYHGDVDLSKDHPYIRNNGWDGDEFIELDGAHKYIASTRISFARSMLDYPLASSMTEGCYLNVLNEVRDALTNLSSSDLKGNFYELEGLATDKDEMIKKYQLLKCDDKVSKDAGALNYWPKGRGIFINNAENFIVQVNEEEHLKFISKVDSGDFNAAYNLLKEAVGALPLQYKYNEKLGWLTFNPTNLGSTINASVMITLTKLRNNSTLQDVATKFNLKVCECSATEGQYEISNKERFGLTEYDAVKKFYEGVQKVIAAEESA